MKHVRITSDGTGIGTRVYDEAGEVMETVVSATLHLSYERVSADLTVVAPLVDVAAEVANVETICPCCGQPRDGA